MASSHGIAEATANNLREWLQQALRAELHECPGPHQRLVYSIDEAAAQLSISKTVLYELINDGAISQIHYGEGRRRVGITHEALVAFIRDREAEEARTPPPSV